MFATPCSEAVRASVFGEEMDIENYYDVCDDCLDKEGGRK